jgi:hypothetical protein
MFVMLAGNAYADSAGTIMGKCNYQQGGKMVEGGNFAVCTTDKMLVVRVVMFGKTALTGLENQDLRYEQIMGSLTPAEKSFAVYARKVIDFSRQVMFDQWKIWSGIAFIFGLFTLGLSAASGAIFDRYSLTKIAYVMLGSIIMVYTNLGVGTMQFLENTKTAVENYITTAEQARQQRGLLETKNVDDTSSDADNLSLIGRKQLGLAEIRYNNLVQKSIVKLRSINLVNSRFYSLTDSGKRNLFSTPDDYMKLVNGNYTFTFNNPENPDQTMFTLDDVLIQNSNYKLGSMAGAFKSIDYESKYSTNANVSAAQGLAEALKCDLRMGPYVDSEALYRASVNTAVTLLYTDTRANSERANMPDFFAETDAAAKLLLNGLCSQAEHVQEAAKQYIKTKDTYEKTGSNECIDLDSWKIMGLDNTSDGYKKEFDERRANFIAKYAKQLLQLNTDYMTALQTDDSSQYSDAILQEGTFTVFSQNRNSRDASQYRSKQLTEFNNGGFVKTIESNAHGEYAQTSYFRDYLGSDGGLQLPVESYVKDVLGVAGEGTPTLNNSEDMVQQTILQNGVSGSQDNDFMKSASLELQSPHEEFAKMLHTNQHVVTSWYKFSARMLNTANKLVIASVTIDIASEIGQLFTQDKNSPSRGTPQATGGVGGKAAPSVTQAGEFNKVMSGIYLILSAITSFLMKVAFYLGLAAFMGMFYAIIITAFVPLVMYALNEFAGIVNTVCLPLVAVTALRPNDEDNFVRLRNNVLAIAFSRVFVGPLILLMYYISWEILDVVMKGVFTFFYDNSGTVFEGGDIQVYIMTFFTLFVSFYAITIANTILQLEAMKKALRATGLRKHALYIDGATDLIDSLLAVLNVLSFNSYKTIKKVYQSVKN